MQVAGFWKQLNKAIAKSYSLLDASGGNDVVAMEIRWVGKQVGGFSLCSSCAFRLEAAHATSTDLL